MRTFLLLSLTIAIPFMFGIPDQVKLWWGIREGVAHFQAERTFEAYKKFLDIVEDFPKLSLTHFNLGTTFDKNEDGPKAEAEYLTAINLNTDPVSVFSANFNLAIRRTKEKKINEALERYQAALKIIPDSKEVKTNIELLFKSQSGGGEGDSNSDQDQKGDKDKRDQKPKDGGKDQKDQKNNSNQPYDQNRKKMPKPFKSEELSKQDMERILEELKRQENQIRGRMHQENKSEEKPVEKDW
jgi:Ca-activated chloride channel homolog